MIASCLTLLLAANPPAAAAAPPALAPTAPVCPKTAPKTDPSSDMSAYEHAVVKQVCVVGAKDDTYPHLFPLVAPRQGKPLDPNDVSADLELLFAQGVLRDVSAIAVPLEGATPTLMLVYAVTEVDRIAEVTVEGNVAVTADAVRSVAELGYPATPLIIHTLVEQTEKAYALIGYPRAKVTVRSETTAPGDAKLTVQIVEGPRLLLSKVRFSGNQRIKTAELAKAVRSVVGGTWVSDTVERDAAAVSNLYFDRGMVTASVIALEPKEVKGALELEFKVTEGATYKLGKVRLEGWSYGPELKALRSLETQPKQIFSRAAVSHDLDRLRHLAAETGADVSVVPQTSIQTDVKIIDLTFAVEPQSSSGAPHF